ncbi:hypothetical protein [Lutimaribacter pacificus]|uniref:hypothetical protein n=1 Tax=Lutimaribacter pacificus TaxID=391948 RepID=UPI00122C9C40|nr:hypothetical protein [Lutimaribacter pacificus]
MKVIVGGRLLRELSETKLRGLLLEWIRSGRAMRLDNTAVDAEEANMAARAISSDDPHILALAELSHCRLVYTDDQNLISDFKNTNFLKPKGKVVKSTTRGPVAASLFEKHRG